MERQRGSQPDWRRLATDPDFEQLWKSDPIERALAASLGVLLDPLKTDLAAIQYARARIAVTYELSQLAERMVSREVPDHESPPVPPKKDWIRRLLAKVGELSSERGGAWPSPVLETVPSPGLRAVPPSRSET